MIFVSIPNRFSVYRDVSQVAQAILTQTIVPRDAVLILVRDRSVMTFMIWDQVASCLYAVEQTVLWACARPRRSAPYAGPAIPRISPFLALEFPGNLAIPNNLSAHSYSKPKSWSGRCF